MAEKTCPTPPPVGQAEAQELPEVIWTGESEDGSKPWYCTEAAIDSFIEAAEELKKIMGEQPHDCTARPGTKVAHK
eukprot:CAMPEP_0202907366 /NCGR_PEP_ID=MMETSP1392-20130828/42240_1 /ASSEMBLY_ACC=CAM_ASM_000868 /TAXON_ID=225041 /ORGANISM="Chlamydomonas chlamydogama, Strain SAG 11-48b" /LENGTH=75 /DNA_ID=CAMNT_0049596211 /DNA_START=263 /DNA_END=490 /DNA_ORIENTATION=-